MFYAPLYHKNALREFEANAALAPIAASSPEISAASKLFRKSKEGCPGELIGTNKQFGKKYGEHRNPDVPGYRTPAEYRARAQEIFSDPNATRKTFPTDAPKYAGETHIKLGDELLRLDPQGKFRSLYLLKGK